MRKKCTERKHIHIGIRKKQRQTNMRRQGQAQKKEIKAAGVTEPTRRKVTKKHSDPEGGKKLAVRQQRGKSQEAFY